MVNANLVQGATLLKVVTHQQKKDQYNKICCKRKVKQCPDFSFMLFSQSSIFLSTEAGQDRIALQSTRKEDFKVYLQGQVPCDVHMRFVIIHPHLSHPQCVSLRVEANVVVVRLLLAFDVCNSRAR